MTTNTPPADAEADADAARITRRRLMAYGAAGLGAASMAASVGSLPAIGAEVTSSNDSAIFTELRKRWRELLLGTHDPSDPVVRQYLAASGSALRAQWDTLIKGGERTTLWADLSSTKDPAHIRMTLERLKNLAAAQRSPGSPLYANERLRDDVLSAFDWLLARRYAPGTRYGNWWEWDIGIPLQLNDLLVLMGDDLGSDRVSAATTSMAQNVHGPDHPDKANASGANLVWICLVAALRGANEGSPEPLTAARSVLGRLFPYVSSGDGFHRDGSFVQHHSLAYNGGYGRSLLANVTDLAHLLSDSQWSLKPSEIETLCAWANDSFTPFIWRGAFMDMVRGRETARVNSRDHIAGHGAIASFMRLAQFAPADQSRVFLSRAKHWINSDDYRDFFVYEPALAGFNQRVSTIAMARSLLQDRSVRTVPEGVGHQVYSGMDRVLHRRPRFAFAVALSSTRISRYEAINNENLRGWHTGDGMTYLYNDDLGQYDDAFWPTVDAQRLPGTTAVVLPQTTPAKDAPRGGSPWAGGVELDGFGASSMQLAPGDSTLTARKSWFCIDDVVACLGAGISSRDGSEVVTTMENRNLGRSGTQTLLADGSAVVPSIGDEARLSTDWLHLEGTGGYVLQPGTQVDVRRQARTGRWSDINMTAAHRDPTEHTRRYVSVVINHGRDPEDASYAYFLLPETSSGRTRAFARSRPVDVIVNAPAVQAVRHKGLGVTMATFWEAGAAAGITTDQPLAVVTRRQGRYLDVSIADPARREAGEAVVTLDVRGSRVEDIDERLTIDRTHPKLRIRARLAGTRGATLRARVRLAAGS
ncbi:polysaccharide lyase 8 family protein [Streptomyces sp. NPDC056405]|uniref:polysaccharide lyase 8 family protein n=1 Tax=Streptomyces sp. NPDC056405 TaxID=3345811 RepID=UPI0035D8DBE6